jgi:hypothetical protein
MAARCKRGGPGDFAYSRWITVFVLRVRVPVSVPISVSDVRTVVVRPSDTSVPPLA